MTRQEILKQIEHAGGEWKPDPRVTFRPKKDGGQMNAVDAEVEDPFGTLQKFYIWNHVDEPNHFTAESNNILALPGVAAAASILARILDLEIPHLNEEDVQRLVERERVVTITDNAKEEYLSGKVQAYEALLLKRKVTLE